MLSLVSVGQNSYYPKQIWKLTRVNGEFEFENLYREQNIYRRGFSDSQQSIYFTGGIVLNTKNYIWHPNFMTLDIGGEYSPESGQENYLVIPDRAEVRTLKSLNINSTHFRNSLITASTLFNISENYSNRENLSNLKTTGKRWGATLLLKSKIVPVSFSYNNYDFIQKEIETGFTYRNIQKNFNASLKKSFSEKDNSELSYTNSNYNRKEFNLEEIKNQINNVQMMNQIYFDNNRNYLFHSNIYYNDQKGNNNFNVLNANENLSLKLPARFNFFSKYNYYKMSLVDQQSTINRISTSVNHQLFESLKSGIEYEYSNNAQTFYEDTRNSLKFNLNYSKKIPTGTLNLDYQFQNLHHQTNSTPNLIPVYNESHSLTDGKITLIEKPLVQESSIVIKDEFGTTIFRPLIDYNLINQGDFIEIQRIPGGQIENGQAVYVDYLALQSGAYQYNGISNSFIGNIYLFDGLLNTYSELRIQDYKNVEYTDYISLNYINQFLIGGKIDVGFVEGGIEYNQYISTITPYKLVRYFLNLNKSINERIFLAANGNVRNYNMLDENINRLYSDISGSFRYQFSYVSNINLYLLYRNQRGKEIDLDLLIGRTEFKTAYRKLHVSLGMEVYFRNYLEEKNNFYGTFIKLSRKF